MVSPKRLPFDPEIWRPVFGPLALTLTVIGYAFSWGWLWIPFGVISLIIFGFFRDPPRRVPRIRDAVLSPADGKVVSITTNDDPEKGPVGGPRICIFLSVFDVHVNRCPLTATVEKVRYEPGQFLNALDDASSDRNESNWIYLRYGKYPVTVRQIAGLIARRIVCRIHPGQRLGAGQRIGMIRFGSRTEIYLPPEARVQTRLGQKVRGGASILAFIPSQHPDDAPGGDPDAS